MRTPFRERYMKRKSKHCIVSTIKTVDGKVVGYQYELTIKKKRGLKLQDIREFTKSEFEKEYNEKASIVIIDNIIKDIK